MKFRPLSVFSIIAYILVGLAITGFVLGPRFVFDPGQNVGSRTTWYLQPIYYLATGILMFLNGLWSPVAPPDDKRRNDDSKGDKTKTDDDKPISRRSRRAAAAAAASGDTNSQK